LLILPACLALAGQGGSQVIAAMALIYKVGTWFRSSLVVALGLLVLTAFASVPPAQAQETMTQGTLLYAKGQYVQARRCFELACNQRPGNWLALYYMAHCDVKLKDFNRAEQEYKRCMQLSADPDVLKACATAIKNVVAHRNTDASIKVATQEVAELESERIRVATKLVTQAGSDFQRRRDEAIAKRESILAEGRKRAEAVRTRAQHEIQDLADNGNWICRNSRTGELRVTIPTVVADEIEANAEVEANRIMREAEARAIGVHIPDYDNTVHHFASSFQDKSKSGPKLNHVGTNLYVRSYSHTPAKPEKKQIAGSGSNM